MRPDPHNILALAIITSVALATALAALIRYLTNQLLAVCAFLALYLGGILLCENVNPSNSRSREYLHV
jgi:hypothetical protein